MFSLRKRLRIHKVFTKDQSFYLYNYHKFSIKSYTSRAVARPYVSACISLCVNIFKHEYLRDKQADRNQILFEHHWDGGKASVGFDPDRIRTLVSMATDSSHRFIMGKRRHHVFSNAFDQILFILAGNDDMHVSLDELEIWPDSTTDYGVSCP